MPKAMIEIAIDDDIAERWYRLVNVEGRHLHVWIDGDATAAIGSTTIPIDWNAPEIDGEINQAAMSVALFHISQEALS